MGVIQAAFRSVLSSLPTVSYSDDPVPELDDREESVATEPTTPRLITPPLVTDTSGVYDAPNPSVSSSLVSVSDKSTPPSHDPGPIEPASPAALLGPIALDPTPRQVRIQTRQRSTTPFGLDKATNDRSNPTTPLGKKPVSRAGSHAMDGATPPSRRGSAFSMGRPLDPNPFTTLPSSPSAGKRRRGDEEEEEEESGGILMQLLGIGGRDGQPVRKKRG